MARILVVDDEVGIRELLSEILSDEGHDIVLAANAAEARQERQAQRPDVVLLDIWMPDMDGVSLLKEWAANGQLTMPVVMMSGHGTIDTAVEATRIGALDFLEKPISLQKLLSAVKRALQHTAPVHATELTLAAFARCALLKEFRKRLEQMAAATRVLWLENSTGSGFAELCAHSVRQPGKGLLDLSSVQGLLDAAALDRVREGVLFVPELADLNRTQQKNLAFAVAVLEKHALHLLVSSHHRPDELLALGWDRQVIARLRQVWLPLPSMEELKHDVPELASQLLAHLVAVEQVPERRFSTAALNALLNRSWSEGYAQFSNAIHSLALAALDEEIGEQDVMRQFPAQEQEESHACGELPLDLPLREAREAFERYYFEYHLRQESNMSRLAEKAGMERTHLYRKLKALGLLGYKKEEGEIA